MAKQIAMSVLKQIIRQWCSDTPVKTIARNTDVSRNTIKRYISLIHSCALNGEELLKMDDQSLESVFMSSPPVNDRYRQLAKQFAYFASELSKTGVNRWVLWHEYKEKHPHGYQYSQFCLYLQRYLLTRQATLHIDQKPGDKLYIDFAGKKLHWIDQHTGQVNDVEVFIAILGHSQLTYAEAVCSQKQVHFIGALDNALRYIKGVPRAIVPDNLKSAVIQSDRYEPQLSTTLSDFANHYQTTILPARSYKPRDKAWVEQIVRTVYSRVYAPLRNTEFHSLWELNLAIKKQLDKHNREHFQNEAISRRERFETQEQQHMLPLPAQGYEHKQYRWQKVMKNSHIQLRQDKHYYSIPYQYIGCKVKIITTQRQVSVYYKQQRIAFHKRDFTPYKYTTFKDHMPSHHRFYVDWNPEKFLDWANRISPQVHAYIKAILEAKVYPEQAYKSCVGILSFAKKVGNHRLTDACKRAAYFHAYSYKTIQGILKNGLEKQQDQTCQKTDIKLPEHENIRGAEAYQ